MRRSVGLVLSVLLTFSLLVTACGTNTTPAETSKDGATVDGTVGVTTAEAVGDVEMTDVGTPRKETLIVDMLNGNAADPFQMNPYMPGCAPMDVGLHQLIFTYLWEIDTVKGEQYGEIAEDLPEAVDDSMTKFRFKIREGLTWSDGVPVTAADVEFTSDMILNTPEFSYSAYYATIVKSMKAIDELTVEVECASPQAKLAQRLGVVIWGADFKVVPKHIWEKEDPKVFKNSDVIGCGPYKLIDRDKTSGNWFLYEKREDWENSTTGIIFGEPAPKYILFKYYGAEEKRIMAAINNEIDILQDITPESWDILKSKNDNAKAWYANFPYADMNDPCERGLTFNCAVAPFDNVDVRWALALATDIQTVSMSTFGGMLRVSPIQLPPIDVLQDTYHKPMTEWLTNFELADGYQPFESTYADDMVDMLTQQGVEGLPAAGQEATDVFGVGWWKYDTEEATKLLESSGFTFKDDKWYKPDGEAWQIVILAPADFEVQSMRLAFSVADSWRKFGIDAQVKQLDSTTFWDAESTGNFEVGSFWPACGLLPDTTTNMAGWHKQFIVPVGERSSGNRARWSNDRVSTLLDELAGMLSTDPLVVDKITEINQEFVQEIPFLPMFGTSKFVPVIETYWTGFQDADNQFEGPWWWWSQFKSYTPNIKAK